jgi:hypothetical protein
MMGVIIIIITIIIIIMDITILKRPGRGRESLPLIRFRVPWAMWSTGPSRRRSMCGRRGWTPSTCE